MTKNQWISFFRKAGDEIITDLEKTKKSQSNKASEINQHIKTFREREIKKIESLAKSKG